MSQAPAPLPWSKILPRITAELAAPPVEFYELATRRRKRVDIPAEPAGSRR